MDGMDTETTSRSVGDEGRKASLRPVEYHGLSLDSFRAKVEQLRNTAHTLCKINTVHVVELTVKLSHHKLDTGRGTMSITLLLDEIHPER